VVNFVQIVYAVFMVHIRLSRLKIILSVVALGVVGKSNAITCRFSALDSKISTYAKEACKKTTLHLNTFDKSLGRDVAQKSELYFDGENELIYLIVQLDQKRVSFKEIDSGTRYSTVLINDSGVLGIAVGHFKYELIKLAETAKDPRIRSIGNLDIGVVFFSEKQGTGVIMPVSLTGQIKGDILYVDREGETFVVGSKSFSGFNLPGKTTVSLSGKTTVNPSGLAARLLGIKF